MGLLDVLKNHQAVENPEYGAKKKLIGDAVCQVLEFTKFEAKSGKEYIKIRTEAINAIPDPKGRDTTVAPGDEISKIYSCDDAESLQELDNDFFTCAFSYSKEVQSEEELIENMKQACLGKLIYFRTWVKDKTAEQIEKDPKSSFYQNVAIKPAKLITPENSIPQMPF